MTGQGNYNMLKRGKGAASMAGTAVLYTGSGAPVSLELTEGENEWNLKA